MYRKPEAEERAIISRFLKSKRAKQIELSDREREIIQQYVAGRSHTELATDFDSDVLGVSCVTGQFVQYIARLERRLKLKPREMSNRGLVTHLLCAARGAWAGYIQKRDNEFDVKESRRDELRYKRELMRRLDGKAERP
jgi:hypothetical protein